MERKKSKKRAQKRGKDKKEKKSVIFMQKMLDIAEKRCIIKDKSICSGSKRAVTDAINYADGGVCIMAKAKKGH